MTYEFESGEDYCRYCQEVSPSARIALSKVTDERKEDVLRKVAEEAARNYGTANGLIKMDNESIGDSKASRISRQENKTNCVYNDFFWYSHWRMGLFAVETHRETCRYLLEFHRRP